ncbi:MAG TPA: hypothetical protein VF832_09570, partial [Longimicrobiales bacterium]
MSGGRNRRRVDRDGEAGVGPEKGGRRRLGLAVAAALLAAGLVAGVVHGWRWATRTHALRIATIRFEGLAHATADELLALSPVKPGDP